MTPEKFGSYPIFALVAVTDVEGRHITIANFFNADYFLAQFPGMLL
jgi:hypothetical protein